MGNIRTFFLRKVRVDQRFDGFSQLLRPSCIQKSFRENIWKCFSSSISRTAEKIVFFESVYLTDNESESGLSRKGFCIDKLVDVGSISLTAESVVSHL